ncbi:putative GTP-binding protein YjiA [compost metagenome]
MDNGNIDLERLLDVRGFNLNADVGLRPLQPLRPATTVNDRIGTLVLRSDKPLDIDRLSEFMDDLLQWHGNSLLRYKGVLNIAGEARRLVFQGVLRLYGFDWDTEWQDGEVRESVMVFIGDNLPEEQIRQGFEAITG